jgi:hypothetical protein
MLVNGAGADDQLLGNLRIRPSLGQQPQHFHFASGELIGIRRSPYWCWRHACLERVGTQLRLSAYHTSQHDLPQHVIRPGSAHTLEPRLPKAGPHLVEQLAMTGAVYRVPGHAECVSQVVCCSQQLCRVDRLLLRLGDRRQSFTERWDLFARTCENTGWIAK